MNKTDGIANVTYLPPCYCSHGGMGKVFDMANEIYGKDFYRYE